ncbi:hypothetical protein SLEP1_g54660 [Rubroshorea leprosula]|uniref:Uncharacterized protein n=1 Tax=Rubroshorea leprosula TaxID=152421 RepID=A0AAV5MD53_9ROSI|nr:hypothetical protein SLEP1_g54660 [Rubroshorea leprosula]
MVSKLILLSKFRALCIYGTRLTSARRLSRLGFGFWGVTDLKKTPTKTQEQLEPSRAMESDDGQIEEQRGRREKESRNGRRRRAKSCAEVYDRSTPIGDYSTTLKGRGTKQMRKKHKEQWVCFEPNLEKDVANDSIEDSGIRNYNRKGGHKEDFRGAKEMWLLAKELGVKIKGDEEDLVRRIARLEEMDKARRKKIPK